jgi:surface protein
MLNILKNFLSIVRNESEQSERPKIIAKNRTHLEKLIKKEIQLNGNECDLNHIDVSNITDMQQLSYQSKFNGNISQWDVSNVTNISLMFSFSQFNGDISNWDTSNVIHMQAMLLHLFHRNWLAYR